jgi:hypothetical protein
MTSFRRRAPIIPETSPTALDSRFDLASDRLDGVRQICRYRFGDDAAANMKRTYRLIELGLLPTGKLGFHHVASKRALRAAYDRLTSGQEPKARGRMI